MMSTTHVDRQLGLRLTVVSVAVILIMMPFAWLLVLVKTSYGPLRDLDRNVAHGLNEFALANPGWVRANQLWTDVFQPWTWRGLVFLIAIWLAQRGAPRLALWALLTMVIGGVLGLVVKVIVDRARPDLPDPVSLAPGAAFPSGHTMGATVGAGVLLLLVLPLVPRTARMAAWTIAAGFAFSVGFTRIALGVHWVSDVLAGLALGGAVVAATAAGFETWRRDQGRRPVSPHREGVEPEAFPPDGLIRS